MGVNAGMQLMLGVPTQDLGSYAVAKTVPIHCVKGHSGSKFCPDCGKPMTKIVESYDFSSLGTELAKVLEDQFEEWDEDFITEGDNTLDDGFGIHTLRTYYGTGPTLLGYALGSAYSSGREETETFDAKRLAELYQKMVDRADEYGYDPKDIKIYGHLYYS